MYQFRKVLQLLKVRSINGIGHLNRNRFPMQKSSSSVQNARLHQCVPVHQFVPAVYQQQCVAAAECTTSTVYQQQRPAAECMSSSSEGRARARGKSHGAGHRPPHCNFTLQQCPPHHHHDRQSLSSSSSSRSPVLNVDSRAQLSVFLGGQLSPGA